MNVTETDLAVAAALYPVLVACARQTPPKKLTYGALLDEAKARFPNVDAVQMAIPVSLGRRLDVMRMFLDEQKLPDLTSLIVNADTGEVGSAFGANPEKVRAEVAAFDWSVVDDEFDLHLEGLRKRIAIRPTRKLSPEAARKVMWDYYAAHRAKLPKDISRRREEIIEMLCDGASPEQAFNVEPQVASEASAVRR